MSREWTYGEMKSSVHGVEVDVSILAAPPDQPQLHAAVTSKGSNITVSRCRTRQNKKQDRTNGPQTGFFGSTNSDSEIREG